MTITEARQICKTFVAKSLSACRRMPRDVLIIAVLVLASSASFGLGYLAGLDAGKGSPPSLEATAGETGKFVASKNGTKYYLPGCAGADRISDANKVWFNSADTAAAAGYTLAVNCK